MNDAAFGRFIERRYQTANLFGIQFSPAAHTFLPRAQTCSHPAIAAGASKRLSGTFRCGFCVSHFFSESGVERRPAEQNVKMSTLSANGREQIAFRCADPKRSLSATHLS